MFWYESFTTCEFEFQVDLHLCLNDVWFFVCFATENYLKKELNATILFQWKTNLIWIIWQFRILVSRRSAIVLERRMIFRSSCYRKWFQERLEDKKTLSMEDFVIRIILQLQILISRRSACVLKNVFFFARPATENHLKKHLMCFSSHILFYSPTLLLLYAAVLLFSSSTLLLFCFATVIFFCSFTSLLYYLSFLLLACFSASLFSNFFSRRLVC